jgi:hypothetical protein
MGDRLDVADLRDDPSHFYPYWGSRFPRAVPSFNRGKP